MSSAHACTSVFFAGKCDSCRHSITSFSEHVVVVESGGDKLSNFRNFISVRLREGLTPFNRKKCTNFSGGKVQWTFLGWILWETTRTNLKLNLVFESKVSIFRQIWAKTMQHQMRKRANPTKPDFRRSICRSLTFMLTAPNPLLICGWAISLWPWNYYTYRLSQQLNE